MSSVLRQLQAEWNTLVPQAQARGIRRVRLLNLPLETIAYRREKLEWLKAQLGVGVVGVATSDDLASFTFGVELECILAAGWSHSRIAAAITAAGVPCHQESYGHSIPSQWKVVTDGSLGDFTRGCEIVSPPLRGEEGLAQVRKVCEVLMQSRARVNRRCGFHVHVGVASESVDLMKNLLHIYAAAEDHIDSFMAPSRRGSLNHFCQSVKSRLSMGPRAAIRTASTIREVVAAYGQSTQVSRGSTRYRKVNLESYWSYETVEFRQHQGTVEAAKAENWVRFCLRLCLMARNAPVDRVSSLDELMTLVGASDSERGYFQSRVTHFNPALRTSRAA